MCDSQTSLINVNKFASKRYCFRVLFTVTFTGKSGNVYLPTWLSRFF